MVKRIYTYRLQRIWQIQCFECDTLGKCMVANRFELGSKLDRLKAATIAECTGIGVVIWLILTRRAVTITNRLCLRNQIRRFFPSTRMLLQMR